MFYLGRSLVDQAKYVEAEQIGRECLLLCEKVLGEEHIDTILTLVFLALILEHHGMIDDAIAYGHRALAGCEKISGPEHAHTVKVKRNVERLCLELKEKLEKEEEERSKKRSLGGS